MMTCPRRFRLVAVLALGVASGAAAAGRTEAQAPVRSSGNHPLTAAASSGCPGEADASPDGVPVATLAALHACLEARAGGDAASSAAVWLALGRLRLALAERGVIARPGLRLALGQSYAEGAVRALGRAVELDPARAAEAAPHLWAALERQRTWGQYPEVARLLRAAAAAHPSDDPALSLARLRLEREMGERAAARRLAERFLAAGGDAGVGHYELAREAFALGDSAAGREAYRTGAQRARSPEALALYRQDVLWIGSRAEIRALDTLSAEGLGDFLERFWAERDARAARPAGARLREHFARLEFALARFRPRVRRRPGSPPIELLTAPSSAAAREAVALDSTVEAFEDRLFEQVLGDSSLLPRFEAMLEARGFDSRGVFYLRHGAPDDRAGYWWLYERDGRTLLVQAVPLNPSDIWPGNKCNLMSRYCAMRVSRMVRQRWDAEERAMMEEALATDRFESVYAETLRPVVQLLGVAGADGRGRVLAVLALRGDELAGRQDSAPGRVRGRTLYPLHLRLTALGADGARYELDTVRTLATPAPLGAGRHLTLVQELRLPPGTYLASVAVEQPIAGVASPDGFAPELIPARGAVHALPGVSVPDPRARAAVLSDLVLGTAGSGLAWTNGARAVPLLPLNAVARGDTLRLYYQAGGLLAGARYRTRIALYRRGERDAKPRLTLEFEEAATAPFQQFERTIALGNVDAGTYDLEVVLTPAEGGPAVARRVTLNVRKR